MSRTAAKAVFAESSHIWKIWQCIVAWAGQPAGRGEKGARFFRKSGLPVGYVIISMLYLSKRV